MDGEPVAAEAEIAEVVRNISADPNAELNGWSAARLVDVGIIDTTGGLYRVDGHVRTRGADRPWTAVLKVLVRPPADPECHEPDSWCYWRREAAFYGSDVATGLPGPMRPPKPFAVFERDDRANVWMEHVSAAGRPWEVAEFERAAHAAGSAAGHYLTGHSLPRAPWLASGFLRGLLADGGFWEPRMDAANEETWGSPLVEPFGPEAQRRVRAVWDDRIALLAVADGLPRALAHGDLHPRNIMLPPDGEQIVAVDWGFCGPAALGADLSDLVLGSAWFCDLGIADVPAIEQATFGAYGAGLRDAGWDGDPRLLRLGYAIHAALRWGACMPGWATFMLAPEQAPSSEQLFGRPAEAVLEQWVRLGEISLELADEARALARGLGLR